ncbi:hypothetical protein Tco_1065038 [Tanacetum coccineum]
MEHDQLFNEFNVGAANQMSLSAEVRMRAEYNIKEKRILKYVIEEKDVLLKARDEEIDNLKAQLLLKEAEAAKAIRLRAEASKFEAIEKSLRDEMKALEERNTTLEKEKNDLNVKVTDLTASVVVGECEVADMDTLVTSVKSQNDKLMDQVHELEISSSGLQDKLSNYENLTERLEEFLDAQLKIVNDKFEKLWITARITHGTEGRALTDVAEYNPFAEADYISALQHLQSVNFSLLVELRSNKDASIDTLIKILRLEDTLAEILGLIESQPHVNQLLVPIYHSSDKVVVGASALSLALDVSSSRIQKIKENIANHRSALRDVFVHLAEPLSVTALTGTEGTSNAMLATAGTTTALSVTFASTSTIAPISVDDYGVTGTDDQAAANENVADGNANPFPNVDDVELNVLR